MQPIQSPFDFTQQNTVAAPATGATPTTPVASTTTAPASSNTAPLDISQSTLSPNFANYVYNMLGKGEQAANLPFQEYTGDRFAAPTDLQQKAYAGLGSLTAPSQFGAASNLAQQAASQLGGLSYTPSAGPSYSAITPQSVSSTFQAPSAYTTGTFNAGFNAPTPYATGTFNAGFNAPTPYTVGSFSSGYTAPDAYNATKFDTGLGALQSVQGYMSPYQQNVIDIQAREARRQADIGRQAEQARLSQAGAYGGSRQAIMEAERQRNLNTQIGDIEKTGLQAAYDRAMQQRKEEAALGLQAQQYGEQAQQYGYGQKMAAADAAARYALAAQQAQEQSRQFGAGQALSAADIAAKYGLAAQQAQEQSRQFGAGQALSAADIAAKYGLAAQQAQEQSRQFGAGQAMTAADLQARYGLDAAKANQLAQLQAATANQQAALEAAKQAEQSRQFGANYGLSGLTQQINAANVLGNLGVQQFNTGLEGLKAQLDAGEQQRALQQKEKDFAYQQWQESMKYPYQQATYMQSLLQGLPVTSRPYDTGQTGLTAGLQGGLSGLALYEALFGKQP